MKKFLCVLISLVMIISAQLPLSVTAQMSEQGKMKVKIVGERMYVRTYYNETYDLVRAFRVNGDRRNAKGQFVNEPFDLLEAGLVLKAEESYTKFDKSLANGDDDVPAFSINNSYIGANHGQSNAVLVEATNHGKTYADLGAIYTAANVNWNLVEIRDENNLLFISDNTASTDNKYVFVSANVLSVGAVMTYKSDGADTDSITIESFTGSVQMLPANKVISVNMYAVKNGVKTPVTATDGIECEYFEVEEHYQIMNPAIVAQALRDNKPEGGYKEPQDLAIGKPILDYNMTYKIMSDGTIFSIYDHEFLENVNFKWHAGHMYKPKHNAFGGSVKRYIPKLKPFTFNDKYYDFTEQYNLTADNNYMGGSEKWVTSELWENPNSMPDRTIEYFYDKNDDLQASFSAGYLPLLDGEPSVRLKRTSQALYLYKSKKMYPVFVDSLAFKETGTKNQHIRGISYAKYNDVTEEDISYYTIDYGADKYIYIDCHEIAKKDITFEELGIRGNSLEVVEKSDNVTYLKDTDSVNVNMPSGTYGYLVLKVRKQHLCKHKRYSRM